MNVEFIRFKVIQEIWKFYVWPEKQSYGTDDLQYLGGKVPKIHEIYVPSFFAIKDGKIIRAAIAGHRTSETLYRIRGLFLDDKVDQVKHFKYLISGVRKKARAEGCKYIWDYDINKEYMNFYKSLEGFVKEEGYILFNI